MTRIIIDTDIGDDIDDALALAFAVSLTQLEVAAVTTVHAEVALRSRIAAKLLDVAGHNAVPIATGISLPFRRAPRRGWAASQGRILEGDEQFATIVSTPAPEFMKEILDRRAAPATLLAIGPLTNVARLLLDHPEVKDQLDEIVIMGGLIGRAGTEYNIHMDPEAAEVVFKAGVPMRVIPLDVTERCLMPDGLLDAIVSDGRPLQFLLSRLIKHWQDKDGRRNPVLHDPLAVGCLAAPELFTFQGFEIDVALAGSEQYGRTIARRKAESPVQVCTDVQYEAFLELFQAAVFQDGARR
jgi:purine nucleosidase